MRSGRRLAVFAVLVSLMTLALTTAPSPLAARAPAGAQPEGSVTLAPDFVPATLGQPATVYITLNGLRHEATQTGAAGSQLVSSGLGAFEFTLRFDPQVVKVARARPGPRVQSGARSFTCLQRSDEPGSFAFGCASTGDASRGLQGSLTLAVVTLEPARVGSSFLVLQAGLAGPLGEEIPVGQPKGGAIAVAGPGGEGEGGTPSAPPATRTPPPAATPVGSASATAGRPGGSGTPLPGVTVELLPTEEGALPAAATAAASARGSGRGASDTAGEGDLEATKSSSERGAGRAFRQVFLWALAAAGSVALAIGTGFLVFRWWQGEQG